MNREEQLNKSIENKSKEIAESSNGSWIDMCIESMESVLSNPSILRHADPLVMEQAGWVREEEWISVEDRLPNASDSDVIGNVLACDFTVPVRGVNLSNYMFVDKKYHTHWKPLPQLPKQ